MKIFKGRLANEDSLSRQVGLGWMLASQDIRLAYRRSKVGPFWVTLSMFIQILSMGIVFSLIFKIDVKVYLPWLAASQIVWGLFSSTLIESCQSIIAGENIIKQMKISKTMFPFRTMFKNLIILAHNFAIIPIAYLVFGVPFEWEMVVVIPGILLMLANLYWMGIVLAIACARYRDLAPIVSSLLTIAYFVTPIMWKPETLGNSQIAHLLLGLNPIYHIYQIVRQPLVGELPTWENWLGSALILLCGSFFALKIYLENRSKIAYWV
jgi:lipopolysaccharide transport system permease protein